MKPYYEHAGIQIFNGDCLEILPTLPKVDLVLTDPPYKFEPSGGGIFGASGWDGYQRTNLARLDALNCCAFNASAFLSLLKPVHLAVFCNKVLLPTYLSFAETHGILFDVHVMQKNNPVPTKESSFLPEIEYIVVLRQPRSHFDNSYPFEWYRKVHYVPQLKGIQKQHPAEKPVSILKKYVGILCPQCGTVLDPYCGSGQTLVAARAMDRHAIGIEIEEKYCEVAAKRLSQEVFDFDGVTNEM